MGQYWICINETKKEYINPHMFGDGAKAMEFSCSSQGMLTALTILLDDGGLKEKFNDQESQVVGRWAGDELRMVGDYGDSEIWKNEDEIISPYDLAHKEWNNISKLVLKIMTNDEFLYEVQNGYFIPIQERLEWND